MKKLLLSVLMAFVASVSYSKGNFITHVTLTTYNPVKEQCEGNPFVTADGTKINLQKLEKGHLRYVAVSRDLLWAIPYGSIIRIEGHGEFEVRDTMNERFSHYVDILQDRKKKNFKKENIKIEVVRKGVKKRH